MYKRVNPHAVVLTLFCLGALAATGGCAGKRVASSSGDASATTKEKAAAAPVETISPDRMATIPDDRRSTTEASRAPLAPSSPAEEGSRGASAGPSDGAAPSAGLAPSDASGPGDVFFDFDQYVIRRDAQPIMEANAVWIKGASGKSVLIEGHCDERGTQAYNLVLGEKRARSAKRYLEDLGVPAARLKIISFGEMRPFCKERDEHCYQLNRRAHFVVR